MVEFGDDLEGHGGKPEQMQHVCQDMSPAFAKGVALTPPEAQISYDRFHVIAMANEAMDSVRRQEMHTVPEVVKEALGDNDRKLLKGLTWAMRHNPQDWTGNQFQAMHWLERTNRQSARAWRLKLAKTLKDRLDGVVRGMLDNRSNAYVQAMNGLLQ